MNSIVLPKGKISLLERLLNFDIQEEIEFNFNNTIYIFEGNNGSGKTTFVEKVLIPLLIKNNIPYSYLGQDVNFQKNTIKSSLAILNFRLKKQETIPMYKEWFEKMSTNKVLIVDEFDKHYSLSDFKQDLKYMAYFIITHAYNKTNIINKNGYAIKKLIFKEESLNRQKNILLKVEDYGYCEN